MTFVRTLPDAVGKWVLNDDNLNQKYIKATTSSIPGIRAKLAPFSEAAKKSGIPNTLVKIAKGIAQFFSTLEASIPAKDFVSSCNTFGDILKVFSITKGVDDILVNADKKNETGLNLHKRNLGIASGFFQVIISGMGGAKLLNTFQLISLADISTALGTTAVLPFAVVANGVEIVKNVVDITNGSIRIHQTNEKRAKLNKNIKKFSGKADSKQIGKFLADNLSKKTAKQLAAEQYLKDKQAEIKTASAAVETALAAYTKTSNERKNIKNSDAGKISKWSQRFPLFFTKISNKAALCEAKAAHDQLVGDYSKERAKFAARITKFDAWTNANAHFNNVLQKDVNGDSIILKDAKNKLDITDPLSHLIADKQIKWKAQRGNCNMDNVKDGLGIAISLVATIGLIAATVLIFTGIGTIPVLLTMTSLWLFVSLMGIGSTLLREYYKPATVPTTDLANYSFAAA